MWHWLKHLLSRERGPMRWPDGSPRPPAITLPKQLLTEDVRKILPFKKAGTK